MISDKLANWLLTGPRPMNPRPTETQILNEIDRLWTRLDTAPPDLESEISTMVLEGEPGVILRAAALQRMGARS